MQNSECRNMVMLVLCRRVIANLLTDAVEKRLNMTAFAEYDYKNVKAAAMTSKPQIALLEIPERYGTPALDILSICAEIKSVSSGCKIMLLCPENDKESVNACVEAKQQSQIDDFIFYDTSTDYLISKICALVGASEHKAV